MNQTRIRSFIAAAGLLAALPAWAAPGDPATPPAAPTTPAAPVAAAAAPVRGQVTAVDATAKTVTVQGRNGDTTVLHTNAATKIILDGTGALSDIKTGQTVRVIGQADGTTITPRMIQVLPPEEAALPAPGGGGNGGGGGGGRRFGTQGVVATVTPTLTITLPDKTTDTVAADDNTRITTTHAGTMADVKTDANVTALTSGTGDAAVATLIHVRAAFGRPGGGNGGGGNGGPPPPAAPTPAAPAPAPPAPAVP